MLSQKEAQGFCYAIWQTREVEGMPRSLVVKMLSSDTPLDIVDRAAAKLMLEYRSSIQVVKLDLGKNYRAIDEKGKVWSCRYGLFDEPFRNQLTDVFKLSD